MKMDRTSSQPTSSHCPLGDPKGWKKPPLPPPPSSSSSGLGKFPFKPWDGRGFGALHMAGVEGGGVPWIDFGGKEGTGCNHVEGELNTQI